MSLTLTGVDSLRINGNFPRSTLARNLYTVFNLPPFPGTTKLNGQQGVVTVREKPDTENERDLNLAAVKLPSVRVSTLPL
jgi:hypothetical protein